MINANHRRVVESRCNARWTLDAVRPGSFSGTCAQGRSKLARISRTSRSRSTTFNLPLIVLDYVQEGSTPTSREEKREAAEERNRNVCAGSERERTEEDVNGSSVDTRWSTCATFSKMLAVAIYRFADEFRGYGGTFDLGTRPSFLFLFAICYRQGTWYPC